MLKMSVNMAPARFDSAKHTHCQHSCSARTVDGFVKSTVHNEAKRNACKYKPKDGEDIKRR
jgi:hypothetical protein